MIVRITIQELGDFSPNDAEPLKSQTECTVYSDAGLESAVMKTLKGFQAAHLFACIPDRSDNEGLADVTFEKIDKEATNA